MRLSGQVAAPQGRNLGSTDDGLVQVTRDDGVSWQDVTPPNIPELAYIGCVEISAHDPDIVYLAATRYKLADYKPYLFRSRDSGRSWQSISDSFPEAEITRVVRSDPVRPGLLFVGTETGVYVSLDEGRGWTRMPGGLPVVPVYDLKVKGSIWSPALTAARSGSSTTSLLFVRWPTATATRGYSCRAPRSAPGCISARWAGFRIPFSFALTFGIGGGIATSERPDGFTVREHLDVGENPPNGVIVYYWLGDDTPGPLTLSFCHANGVHIVTFASDDEALPLARRPSVRRGLNRFIWDMKYPGPVRVDPPWATLRNRPLANEPEPLSGPTVVPGEYRLEFTAGSKTGFVDFSIARDPRLATAPDDYATQFALLKELYDKVSALNGAVNRIRPVRRQLLALTELVGGRDAGLTAAARAVCERLLAIEGVLVDVRRESPRDVLRNPAGLSDTLVDMINTAAIADTAPTASTIAVSRETMARVDAEIAKLDALMVQDIAEVNRLAAERSVAHIQTLF